jgi:hypothetical protein
VIKEICWRTFIDMSTKQVQIPDSVISTVFARTSSTLDLDNNMKFIEEECIKKGKCTYTCHNSFMMGIFNDLSSFTGLCRFKLARKIFNLVAPGSDLNEEIMVHSDDYGVAFDFTNPNDLRVWVICDRIAAKLMNKKINKKKTEFSRYFWEVLSIWFHNGEMNIPQVKFLRSPIR